MLENIRPIRYDWTYDTKSIQLLTRNHLWANIPFLFHQKTKQKIRKLDDIQSNLMAIEESIELMFYKGRETFQDGFYLL